MKPVEILWWNDTRGKIVSHGYMVPYLQAVKHAGKDDGLIDILLDERFAITIHNDEELQYWIPFLANAMAIAGGFSCHGENCVPMNRFKTKCMQIGSVETDADKEEE